MGALCHLRIANGDRSSTASLTTGWLYPPFGTTRHIALELLGRPAPSPRLRGLPLPTGGRRPLGSFLQSETPVPGQRSIIRLVKDESRAGALNGSEVGALPRPWNRRASRPAPADHLDVARVWDLLPLLEYLAERPRASPERGFRELGLGRDTWYLQLDMLEALHLLSAVRGTSSGHVHRYVVTPRGRRLLEMAAAVRSLVSDSPAALGQMRPGGRIPTSTSTASELICRFIDHTEKFVDLRGLWRLQALSSQFGLDGHHALCRAVEGLLTAEFSLAYDASCAAVRLLLDSGQPQALAKAYLVRASAQAARGQWHDAFESALLAQSETSESSTAQELVAPRIATALVKLRMGLSSDGARMVSKAESIASRSGDSVLMDRVFLVRALLPLAYRDDHTVAGLMRVSERNEREGIILLAARARLQLAVELSAMGQHSSGVLEQTRAKELVRPLGKRWVAATERWARVGGPSSIGHELAEAKRSSMVELAAWGPTYISPGLPPARIQETPGPSTAPDLQSAGGP